MRGDYLNSDRQSFEQSHWGDRTGQVHAATPTRPEQLVNNGFLPTVNFDGAIRSLRLMVVREGGGSSGWAKEKVELVKIFCLFLLQVSLFYCTLFQEILIFLYLFTSITPF